MTYTMEILKKIPCNKQNRFHPLLIRMIGKLEFWLVLCQVT